MEVIEDIQGDWTTRDTLEHRIQRKKITVL